MYKFKSYLLGMLAVASMAAITSCKDDGEKLSPAIALSGPDSNGGTVTVGHEYDIIVSANSNGGSELERLEVLYSLNGSPDGVHPSFTKTGINSAAFIDTFSYTALISGTEKYTFRVTNKDGKTAQRSVTFTVATETPSSYPGVTLGGSLNTSAGHFFSAQTGQVLTPAQAQASSEKVDIIFYHENANPNNSHGATLAAPSNLTAQQIYPGIGSWPTKNITTFKMGTASDMLITTNSGLVAAYNSTTAGGGTTLRNLQVDDAVLFRTEGGKHGVLQITQIGTTPSNAHGTIQFNAKVQP